MSKVTVTKKFRDNFEEFIAHRLATGQFSEQQAVDFKELIRTDLKEGPDQLRGECEFFTIDGVKIPAVIDDAGDRYRLWDSFFADECEIIHQQKTGYIGTDASINQRIRADLATQERKAA